MTSIDGTDEQTDGPLRNIKVLDLSRILAGPWASQVLGDMGADIIKVERPGSGDDTRRWGPPFVKDASGGDTSESAYYHCANRNKKSITLDFTKAEGKALLLELVKQSDVLIENYKFGGLKKYGLDFESLKTVNPQLIYCSITGFGQTGPYAPRAGYDFLIQAMGGLMSVTGEEDSKPGGGPQKVGVALVDIMTGLYAAIAILGAVNHRHLSNEGQHIDIALLDVQVATLANQAMNYLTSGTAPKRMGNAHPNIVPYQSVKTRDGYMILAIGNDGQFQRFCDLIEEAELATHKDYATNSARVENRDRLMERLAPILETKDTDEWTAFLENKSVPCGPINTIDKVFADPQVQAREMLFSIDHPLAGKAPQVRTPIGLSASPLTYEQAPPTLGQHTDEVLRGRLGLNEAEIKSLKSKDIV